MENLMDYYTVKRLALVLAIQSEIEGMKATNSQYDFGSEPYTDVDFRSKAEQLRELAYKHNEQL